MCVAVLHAVYASLINAHNKVSMVIYLNDQTLHSLYIRQYVINKISICNSTDTHRVNLTCDTLKDTSEVLVYKRPACII